MQSLARFSVGALAYWFLLCALAYALVRPFLGHWLDSLLAHFDFAFEGRSAGVVRLNLNRESSPSLPKVEFGADSPIPLADTRKMGKIGRRAQVWAKMVRGWAAEKLVLPLLREADLCQSEFASLSARFARSCGGTPRKAALTGDALLSSYLCSLKANFRAAREVMAAKSHVAATLSRAFGFDAAAAHKTALRRLYGDLSDGGRALSRPARNAVLSLFAERAGGVQKSPVLCNLAQLPSFEGHVAIVRAEDEGVLVAQRKPHGVFGAELKRGVRDGGRFTLRPFGDDVLQAIAVYLFEAKEGKVPTAVLLANEVGIK